MTWMQTRRVTYTEIFFLAPKLRLGANKKKLCQSAVIALLSAERSTQIILRYSPWTTFSLGTHITISWRITNTSITLYSQDPYTTPFIPDRCPVG